VESLERVCCFVTLPVVSFILKA